jgi:hypothetical protein
VTGNRPIPCCSPQPRSQPAAAPSDHPVRCSGEAHQSVHDIGSAAAGPSSGACTPHLTWPGPHTRDTSMRHVAGPCRPNLLHDRCVRRPVPAAQAVVTPTCLCDLPPCATQHSTYTALHPAPICAGTLPLPPHVPVACDKAGNPAAATEQLWSNKSTHHTALDLPHAALHWPPLHIASITQPPAQCKGWPDIMFAAHQ